jgi:hypothetical protein
MGNVVRRKVAIWFRRRDDGRQSILVFWAVTQGSGRGQYFYPKRWCLAWSQRAVTIWKNNIDVITAVRSLQEP